MTKWKKEFYNKNSDSIMILPVSFSQCLYYKNITIVNDMSRDASELRHYLEHLSQLSVTLLESSIMLLEL